VACVRALADLLNECGVRVTLDTTDIRDYVENKIDTAYRQIRDAQRVLLVHSVGAYHRYQVSYSWYDLCMGDV
jgi:hypothetical protein